MKTGFGRNARAVLSYLYSTGKYDILHYCCGINKGNKVLTRTPWKSVGCIPEDPSANKDKDPSVQRNINCCHLLTLLPTNRPILLSLKC